MRDKPTPKKLLPIIIVLLVAMTGATGYVLSTKYDQKDDKKPTATHHTEQKPVEKTQPAGVQPVGYNGQDGKTALELLKANATVVTKDSSYGPYVDSINGVQGGTDGKYWAFYVNDEMAQVGADAYQTKSGDKIEWKFE